MTLSAVASFTQKFIIFSTIAATLGVISFVGFKIWYANYLSNLPPVEEKPEIKWGVLPTPDFPSPVTSANNYTFSIDTQSGLLSLEKFEKVLKVFFIPKGVTTFLASQRASDLASKFGVTAQPEILSETKYRFSSSDRNLLVDIDTSNFSYSKEASQASKLTAQITDSATRLAEDFKSFLANKNLLSDDLKEGPVKISYLKFDGNILIPAEANQATAVQISIWPKSINGKQLITPNIDRSLISAVLVKSAVNLENYISLNYTYWPIDQTTFTTYPVKSAETAFNDLKSGKGVIVLVPDKPQISITSIKLAYYQSDKYTPYLEPIFIFEGPVFVALVAAIDEQYLSTAR